MGNGCQFCLPPVHVVAVLLYLSVLPFHVENLIWIWLYQFQSSLIYIEYILLTITIVRQETTIIKNSFSGMKTVYCIICLSLLFIEGHKTVHCVWLVGPFENTYRNVQEESYHRILPTNETKTQSEQTISDSIHATNQRKENQPIPSSITR